ncbi:ty3-gypsy retrotransposon protein [Tanacetum coccineum]
MSGEPILGLPNFEEMFVVEADASDVGIGAVLMQRGHLFGYFNRKLGPRIRIAATYQKELFAIVEAVYNWRQYLWGRHFTIRTDHRSLKELMQQVIQTPLQQKYVRKLMGFDFIIEYKPGVTNGVADALSRVFEEEEVVTEFRNTPTAGHSGIKKMLVGLSALFYWKGMRKSVEEFIGKCLVCQETKYSTQAPGGLLQPLPTPSRVWEDFSMDFITGLPASKGLSVIFVVGDRFNKYAHFGPLPASFNVPKVVDVFIDMVVKHHGIPKTIASDRDPIFVSKFWKQLFEASGTKLNHNTAYHPQTDGKTKVVDQGLEQYFRVMVSDQPHQWVRLLPLAEYNYNTSFHSSMKICALTMRFYGVVALTMRPYFPSGASSRAIERCMIERDALLRQLKQNLLVTKHHMGMQANRKSRDVEFNTGDMVLVKLQPYRQVTLAKRHSNKLAKRYYGPFKVLERVCKVAYRLALPDSSKIHSDEHEGQPVEQPLEICDTRIVLQKGVSARQVLVQWSGSSPEEVTWEWLSEFKIAYPSYHLEDKVIFEGEGNDTPEPEPNEKPRPKRVTSKPIRTKKYTIIHIQLCFFCVDISNMSRDMENDVEPDVPPVLSSPRDDAMHLYKAFKGLGCDTAAVVNILAHRDASQRALIENEYKTMYHEDLTKRLSSELSGNVKKAVLLWMPDPARRDAMILHDALTTDIDLKAATEVICSRTPSQIQYLKQLYHQLYGTYIEHAIQAQTSGDLEQFVLRDES